MTYMVDVIKTVTGERIQVRPVLSSGGDDSPAMRLVLEVNKRPTVASLTKEDAINLINALSNSIDSLPDK